MFLLDWIFVGESWNYQVLVGIKLDAKMYGTFEDDFSLFGLVI